jgi:MoaA/NifB/PqqE/SkfB family radical SAM enzyme
MYNFSQIQSLQLEITNHCNAACPQCPRNFFGGAVIPTLPLQRWSAKTFQRTVSSLIPQLTDLYFCGTYGDPCTNSELVAMAELARSVNPNIRIGLHTNGGANRPEFFERLAQTVDFVAFGIDGVADTNHVYRRGVKWNRVMENVTSFIKAGGQAHWDYIVFAHNQHQVESARKLSQDLGFSRFSVKRTGRFLGYDHVAKDSITVYRRNGKPDYDIAKPTDPQYLNTNYQVIQQIQQHSTLEEYAQSTKINCNACRIGEVYVGADGFVFPCGWLHDRLYGPKIDQHSDYGRVRDLMTQSGGWTQANVFHTPLEQIVNGAWFQAIEQSWNNAQRLSRCGVMCGDRINLIGDQNSEIVYKK